MDFRSTCYILVRLQGRTTRRKFIDYVRLGESGDGTKR